VAVVTCGYVGQPVFTLRLAAVMLVTEVWGAEAWGADGRKLGGPMNAISDASFVAISFR